jgi:3-methyladenine DNA glycosylase/8-oxoguanine DNA glycosylase
VALETCFRPRGPYALEESARRGSDATRFYRDGYLTLAYEVADEPVLARVWQWRDGRIGAHLSGASTSLLLGEAVGRLRFLLAVDDDHSPFLRRFKGDPLLADAIRRSPGLRPLRTGTVAHSLLKAVCGQLIQAKAARLLENRLIRLACPEHAGLRLPPTRRTFAAFAPAELVRQGLAARKAGVLVRLSREIDPEKLRAAPTCDAVSRIVRERGLGPWSAGMICLYGLGRYEHGLVGDLGLVKLAAALRGRWVDAEDTWELLEPYGEWAGLASVYLLSASPVASARPPRASRRSPSRSDGPSRRSTGENAPSRVSVRS